MKRAKAAGLDGELKELSKALQGTLKEIEETIIQTKSKSAQDPLNYPIRLNDKIGALAYTVDGDHPPTAQSRRVFEYLDGRLQEQLARLDAVLADDVEAFNDAVLDLRVPAIVLEDDEAGRRASPTGPSPGRGRLVGRGASEAIPERERWGTGGSGLGFPSLRSGLLNCPHGLYSSARCDRIPDRQPSLRRRAGGVVHHAVDQDDREGRGAPPRALDGRPDHAGGQGQPREGAVAVRQGAAAHARR
jgi:hypothetical protein